MYKVTIINDGKRTEIHHPEFNELKLQEGTIKQVVNLASTFSFKFLPFNPGYNLIRPFKTLVEVKNMKTGKMEFEGRARVPSEYMDDSGKFGKSLLCEGELAYLNDSAQRHGEFRDITIRAFLQHMIDQHNREIANDNIDKRFVLGNVTVVNNTDNVYRYLGYESTWASINDKLIDRLGGELWIRKENGVRYLDYLEKGGDVKKTEIRLAHNLKSIEKEADPNEIITRLIPLGVTIESEDEQAVDASQARLTIESVNNGLDYIEDDQARAAFGIITKSVNWDDITIPANLIRTGRNYLAENNRVKVKHVIEALDLYNIGKDPDSFECGNSYPVINPIMAINETLRVVEKNIDIINPANNNMIVGDLFKTASQYQNDVNRSARTVVDLQNTIHRQARTIGILRSEVDGVNETVSIIKITLEDNDLPGLDQAVKDLNAALDELNESLGDLPDYQPATSTNTGLMTAADKQKLDGLKNYELATELVSGLFDSVDKEKLNKITATQLVNLDDVLLRLSRLEGGS
ncbi:phage tail spike protein [Alkalicoccobacillus plakortidis]|uniref:Phage tail protein n=1 Tax=Alkalicoccobacillus plakortidis TaxID=444060 RepID=A0ABT0XK08_9BACI|nr:phage tail spike protein [Alkalicoccobacillus plakortidis]MCM2675569.1 phage tail protein [Alkalicoccobacillus plakortidis]